MNERQDMDKLVKTIGEAMQAIQKQAESALPVLSQEITEIITAENKDRKRIEGLLDQLLSLASLNVGGEEFLRLNNYYQSLDPRAALFYHEEYKSQKDL